MPRQSVRGDQLVVNCDIKTLQFRTPLRFRVVFKLTKKQIEEVRRRAGEVGFESESSVGGFEGYFQIQGVWMKT